MVPDNESELSLRESIQHLQESKCQEAIQRDREVIQEVPGAVRKGPGTVGTSAESDQLSESR